MKHPRAKSKKKIVSLACLLFLSTFALYPLYLFFHKEFDVEDFSYAYPLVSPHRFQDAHRDLTEIESILDQKFFYLDKGKQMTAFESADHKYVIKFFNPRPFLTDKTFQSIKKFKSLFSIKWISYAFVHRKERLKRLAAIYDDAFDHFRDQSALVYVGLSLPTIPPKQVLFITKSGKEKVCDLSKMPFVLQRKVAVAQKHLLNLIREGRIEETKACLESLADLFIDRARLGYTDRIQTLHNNYGFEGLHAVQIDLGRLRKFTASQIAVANELERIFMQLQMGISASLPEMQTFIAELIEKKQALLKI